MVWLSHQHFFNQAVENREMGLFMISGRHGQDIWMCSWAKTLGFHGTSLQPGEYMRTGKLSVKPDEMLGGTLAMDWQPIQGRVEILLVISCHGTDQIPSGVKIPMKLA